MSEVKAAEHAAPARASFRGVGPPRPSEPTAYTKAAARAAPAIATQMYDVGSASPRKAMPTTTNSAAPAVTPRMPGSARGLRVTPCITAPETARAAPTSIASTVRGTRLATAASPMVSVLPSTPFTTSSRPTERTPRATEATAARPRRTRPVSIHRARDDADRREVAVGAGTRVAERVVMGVGVLVRWS